MIRAGVAKRRASRWDLVEPKTAGIEMMREKKKERKIGARAMESLKRVQGESVGDSAWDREDREEDQGLNATKVESWDGRWVLRVLGI